jgi:hypothetical protein
MFTSPEFVDRRNAVSGNFYWAFIEGKPDFIQFKRLRPYNGFFYCLEDAGNETLEASDEALFAYTKKGLVDVKIESIQWKIDQLQKEIENLKKL